MTCADFLARTAPGFGHPQGWAPCYDGGVDGYPLLARRPSDRSKGTAASRGRRRPGHRSISMHSDATRLTPLAGVDTAHEHLPAADPYTERSAGVMSSSSHSASGGLMELAHHRCAQPSSAWLVHWPPTSALGDTIPTGPLDPGPGPTRVPEPLRAQHPPRRRAKTLQSRSRAPIGIAQPQVSTPPDVGKASRNDLTTTAEQQHMG
jgi:hypothetical protein